MKPGWLFRRDDRAHLLGLAIALAEEFEECVGRQFSRQVENGLYARIFPFRRELEDFYRGFVRLGCLALHYQRWRI